MNQCPDCGGINNHYVWCGATEYTKINQLQSELAAYKIALKYFIDNGGQPALDIANNLLKEVGGLHDNTRRK